MGEQEFRKFDLEDRLIEFAISVINLSRGNFLTFEQTHLLKQLIRSATSTPLHYGEAQGAESQRDFIHKMSIGLKELRESQVNLKILKGTGLIQDLDALENVLDECGQLVAIFTVSIRTAKSKL